MTVATCAGTAERGAEEKDVLIGVVIGGACEGGRERDVSGRSRFAYRLRAGSGVAERCSPG